MITLFSTLSVLNLITQPLHCLAMCSPQYSLKREKAKHAYLAGRFISYTAMGSLFGAAGQKMFKLLEVEIFKYLAFSIFLIISLLLFASWFGLQMRLFPQFHLKTGDNQLPHFFHGLLSVTLPCPIILQMTLLSVLTQSFIGGALVGAMYSFMTGLVLILGSSLSRFISLRSKRLQAITRTMLGVLVITTLVSFVYKLFFPEQIEALSPLGKAILCLS